MSAMRSPFKTADEMRVIREQDAALRAKAPAPVAEKNEAHPVAYFEVSRYVKGPCRGLFLVHQLIAEDAAGRPLKKPLRKLVVEGVDAFIATTKMEEALRARVFR